MNQATIAPDESRGSRYQVVARRYRPRGFVELVGQEPVIKALSQAIATRRVGHAYLFTGARGVGKTSAARIFAKCLNCAEGPTATPCQVCESCVAVATGEDVDVLEIDGASNRGIDEIRQLRANVSIRPSRSEFKIYIIDEVHMLTKEAFNALLKTLEEPPPHVKFIFCTTDPEKMPITVLSRCQRFDFAPIGTERIADRLAEIVATEGATADRDALEMLARRAAGSMRDSQSLLEQLLSLEGGHLTLAAVHHLLGTAQHHQVLEVITALAGSNAVDVLRGLDDALRQGVDVGQFAEQLLLCLRDVLVCGVGGSRDILLSDAVGDEGQLRELAHAWGTPAVLLAMQILESGLARMRYSSQPRTVMEMALVQAAHLGELVDVREVQSLAESSSPSEKKKSLPPTVESAGGEDEESGLEPDGDALTTPSGELSNAYANDPVGLWNSVLGRLDGLAAEFAGQYASVRREDSNVLVVSFAKSYSAERCERPEERRRIEQSLREIGGHHLQVQFRVDETVDASGPPVPRLSQRELIRKSYQHPFVQQVVEMFDGTVRDVQKR